MANALWVALAGAAGVLLRYWIGSWAERRFGAGFPVGTLIVNLAGCFAAGFLAQLFARGMTQSLAHGVIDEVGGALGRNQPLDPRLMLAVMVGFLGGFTTFSAFSVQSVALFTEGKAALALLNVALSNLGGLALAWAGYALSRAL